MPKNREYTGLVRTPSSMAWLIAQRARLRGQLERCMRQQKTLPEKIQRLELELACPDHVIPFHEVKVPLRRLRSPHWRCFLGCRCQA